MTILISFIFRIPDLTYLLKVVSLIFPVSHRPEHLINFTKIYLGLIKQVVYSI